MSDLIVAPSVEIINGNVRTTSLKVAEHFGKLHKNVLRAIKNLDCSKEFARLNFEQCSRINELANGKQESYYVMSRDGFTFLAMGFTGKEAAKWKEAYINAFNRMEAELLSKQTPNALKSLEPPTIAPHQQHALQVIVARKSGAVGAIRAMLWSRFNNHFRLGSYKQLPAEKFDEAVAYLEGIQTAHDPARVPGLDKVYSYPRSLLEQPTFRGMNGEAPAVLNLGMVTHDDFRSPLADLLREMAADGHTVDGAMAEYVTLRESLVHAGQALRHVMSAAWDALGAPCSPTGQLH